MSYATVTLTGKVTSPTGAASRSGFSIMANTPRVVDAAGKVVLAGAVAIQPDATGAFSVALPATDDVNLTPSGFQYRILGHHGIDTTFSLPTSLGTVDLAELVPVTAAPLPEEIVLDATVKALVDNPGSGVRASLSGLYATPADVVALVPGEVANAVAGHTPGSEMLYVMRATNFSTTNTGTNLALISGLVGVTTGVGRPCLVEAFLPRVSHSVVDGGVMLALYAVKTGSPGQWIMLTERYTPKTAAGTGEGIYIRRRWSMAADEEWTFGVYMSGVVAGTSTLYAGGGTYPNPASLTVISR